MPKLSDPEEYALIKKMYFQDDTVVKSDLDPVERWERMQRKRTINQSR